MIRPHPATAVLAAVLALTGCSSGEPEPAAAPTSAAPATTAASPSPSSTSTEEGDRFACREVAKASDVEVGANLSIAAVAKQSSDPGIAVAGQALDAAVNAKQFGTVSGTEANIRIAEAQLDLAKACSALFGDGPW